MPKVLRQYKVILEKTEPNQSITGESPDNLGLRTKLGGKPDWIQEDETPQCPSCHAQMSFVGQIDSIEHQSRFNTHSVSSTSPDQGFMFGDVGMIYVFYCFDCGETQSLIQGY